MKEDRYPHRWHMYNNNFDLERLSIMFPNTFLPCTKQKELPLSFIIFMLSWGLKFQDLPEEVKAAVRKEMDRRHKKQKEIEALR